MQSWWPRALREGDAVIVDPEREPRRASSVAQRPASVRYGLLCAGCPSPRKLHQSAASAHLPPPFHRVPQHDEGVEEKALRVRVAPHRYESAPRALLARRPASDGWEEAKSDPQGLAEERLGGCGLALRDQDATQADPLGGSI